MRWQFRSLVVLGITSAASVLAATPASAKVPAFELQVSDVSVVVGQAVELDATINLDAASIPGNGPLLGGSSETASETGRRSPTLGIVAKPLLVSFLSLCSSSVALRVTKLQLQRYLLGE